jgi:hypothetical protein
MLSPRVIAWRWLLLAGISALPLFAALPGAQAQIACPGSGAVYTNAATDAQNIYASIYQSSTQPYVSIVLGWTDEDGESYQVTVSNPEVVEADIAGHSALTYSCTDSWPGPISASVAPVEGSAAVTFDCATVPTGTVFAKPGPNSSYEFITFQNYSQSLPLTFTYVDAQNNTVDFTIPGVPGDYPSFLDLVYSIDGTGSITYSCSDTSSGSSGGFAVGQSWRSY